MLNESKRLLNRVPLSLAFQRMCLIFQFMLGQGCGRKLMTNLDSIIKSKDIALPTKVHLVKAMFFPVVMYGCESWTVKKAER